MTITATAQEFHLADNPDERVIDALVAGLRMVQRAAPAAPDATFVTPGEIYHLDEDDAKVLIVLWSLLFGDFTDYLIAPAVFRETARDLAERAAVAVFETLGHEAKRGIAVNTYGAHGVFLSYWSPRNPYKGDL